ITLTMLADGDITLTTITVLGPHLTDENHEILLAAARRKGKREVERLVAALDPQPDIASSVRKLPEPRTIPARISEPASADIPALLTDASFEQAISSSAIATHVSRVHPSPSRAVVAPIAPERYL